MRVIAIVTIVAAVVALMWTAKADGDYTHELTDAQLMALVSRVYANDMKSESGRVRWHGKVATNVLDDVAMTMTSHYADGYAHVKKALPKAVVVRTPEEIAERRAKRLAELKRRMPKGAAESELARETGKVVTNTVTVTITPEEAK